MVKLFGKTIEVVEGDGGGEHENIPSSDTDQGRRDRESTGSEFDCNVKEEDRDVDSKEDEILKKRAEKILPCPRCNSEDTKFCYFNNYNVNQPRYFCRNCQRYWTAGGSMRNVPVGAGRRKHKITAAVPFIYRRVTIKPTSPTGLRPSSTPSSLPVQYVIPNYEASGATGGPAMSLGSGKNVVDGDDNSCGSSSLTASNSMEDGVGVQGHGYPICGSPWIYPPWINHSLAPPSNFLGVTLLPPPPSTLGFSLNPQQQCQQQPWLISSQSSQPTYSPLGKKHSRDGNNVKIRNAMTIEDPSEAANSSMWLKVGVDQSWTYNGFSEGGVLLKPIKPKVKLALDASNPAAFSRSQCFHEST